MEPFWSTDPASAAAGEPYDGAGSRDGTPPVRPPSSMGTAILAECQPSGDFAVGRLFRPMA